MPVSNRTPMKLNHTMSATKPSDKLESAVRGVAAEIVRGPYLDRGTDSEYVPAAFAMEQAKELDAATHARSDAIKDVDWLRQHCPPQFLVSLERIRRAMGAPLPECGKLPVMWRREWDGDVSDIGQWVYADSADERDEPLDRWQPLYETPQAAPPPMTKEEHAAAEKRLFDELRATALSASGAMPDRDDLDALAGELSLAIKCTPDHGAYAPKIWIKCDDAEKCIKALRAMPRSTTQQFPMYLFGSAIQCKAPSQNMSIGGDDGWKCHSCGASRANPECRYTLSARGTT